MIPITDEYKAFLASNSPGRVSCALFKRTDNLVVGLSEYSRLFNFSLEAWMRGFGLAVVPAVLDTSVVQYGPISAYFKTDIASTSDMSVGSVELSGPSALPSITEDDLRAGLWDFCGVTLFEINVNDLTMGALIRRCGNIGQVSMAHPEVKVEILGTSKAYQRTIARIIKPSCDWSLYSVQCTVDPASFTVTGTIEGIGQDGLLMIDSSRTESGPTTGVAITGITNANPGVVSTATDLGLPDGAAVTIAGVVGPDALNGITVIHNPGSGTFELGEDTSDTSEFPPYVSGGTVTPLGGGSGWFDYGQMTITSGLLTGMTRDVRTYVPGQWTLWIPFPPGLAIGDTYSMVAGCDKSFDACRNKFGNGINFGGFPYVPGIDQLTRPSSS